MKMNKILAAGAAAVVLAGFSGCSKKGGAPAAEEKVETVFAVNAIKQCRVRLMIILSSEETFRLLQALIYSRMFRAVRFQSFT